MQVIEYILHAIHTDSYLSYLTLPNTDISTSRKKMTQIAYIAYIWLELVLFPNMNTKQNHSIQISVQQVSKICSFWKAA